MKETETVTGPVRLPSYIRLFYLLSLISLICLLLIAGASLFIPIILGAFFAMLLVPVARRIEKMRLGRFVGATTPVVAMVVAVLAFFRFVVSQVASIAGSLEDAREQVSGYIEKVDRSLRWHLNLEEPLMADFNGERLVAILRNYSGDLLRITGEYAGSAFIAVLVPLFTLFFLYYRRHLFEFLVRLFKEVPRPVVERRAEATRTVAEGYLVGLMKVVGILAVLNSVALILIGVEHAIFFGIFAAILNVVPFVGPIVGSILPALFVLLTRESLYYPKAVVGAFVLIQMLEGSFLTPNIVGKQLRLNPLTTLIGLFAGGLIWGVIGMIIAIPVLSIAMYLFKLSPRTESFAFLLSSPPDKKPG